jgi:hypothetical protein
MALYPSYSKVLLSKPKQDDHLVSSLSISDANLFILYFSSTRLARDFTLSSCLID